MWRETAEKVTFTEAADRLYGTKKGYDNTEVCLTVRNHYTQFAVNQ